MKIPFFLQKFVNKLEPVGKALILHGAWRKPEAVKLSIVGITSLIIDFLTITARLGAIFSLSQAAEIIAVPAEENEPYPLLGFMGIDNFRVSNDPYGLLIVSLSAASISAILPVFKKLLWARYQNVFPKILAKEINKTIHTIDYSTFELKHEDIKEAVTNIEDKCALLIPAMFEKTYPAVINLIVGMISVGSVSTDINSRQNITMLLVSYGIVDLLAYFLPEILISTKARQHEKSREFFRKNILEVMSNMRLVRLSNQSYLELKSTEDDIDEHYNEKTSYLRRYSLLGLIGPAPSMLAKFALVSLISHKHQFVKDDIAEILFLFNFIDIIDNCIQQAANGLRDGMAASYYIQEMKNNILNFQADELEARSLKSQEDFFKKANSNLTEVVVGTPDEKVQEIALLNDYDNREENNLLSNGIKFEDVDFLYPGADDKALKDIKMLINNETKVGLVGQSRSGKSTLVNLLMGLYEPTKGKIYIGRKEIRQIDRQVLREMIGIVPQSVEIFPHYSLKYNVLYSCSELSPYLYAMKLAMKKVNSNFKIHKMEMQLIKMESELQKLKATAPSNQAMINGMSSAIKQHKDNILKKKKEIYVKHFSTTSDLPEDKIGKYKSELISIGLADAVQDDKDFDYVSMDKRELHSGGTIQRIGVARLLVKNSKLFIFDESTSALDPENEEKVSESIINIVKKENKTSLIITHRLHLAKDADAIFVLNEGKIIENGTHKNLIDNNRIYSAFWKKQAHLYQDELLSKNSKDEVLTFELS